MSKLLCGGSVSIKADDKSQMLETRRNENQEDRAKRCPCHCRGVVNGRSRIGAGASLEELPSERQLVPRQK